MTPRLPSACWNLGGTVPPKVNAVRPTSQTLLKADIARWNPILKAAAEKDQLMLTRADSDRRTADA